MSAETNQLPSEEKSEDLIMLMVNRLRLKEERKKLLSRQLCTTEVGDGEESMISNYSKLLKQKQYISSQLGQITLDQLITLELIKEQKSAIEEAFAKKHEPSKTP